MKIALTLIFFAGLISTFGNLLLKASRKNLTAESSLIEQYMSPLFLAALAFYALNLVLFSKALDFLPVSVGYPILAASGFIILAVMSWFILGERLSWIQIIGIAIIIMGIFMLSHMPKN